MLLHLGKGQATKSDKLSEKFQTAFGPPPHFRKIMMQIFYDRYGCIYARRYDGHTVWNGGGGKFRSAFFKMCLVLIFLNTMVEKTYPEP